MNETISSFYARYRTLGLLLAGGLVMILSFLWYLPGAYHASNMGEYHVYSFSEFRFNNVIAMYVNHNLDKYDGPSFIVKGTGIEYPPLMSMLIRGAAGVKPVHEVPLQVYRSGTPQKPAGPEAQTNSVVAYTWLNYAVDLVFGLLCIYLLSLWPGARPLVFVLSPLLFLFAGYNGTLYPLPSPWRAHSSCSGAPGSRTQDRRTTGGWRLEALRC